MKDDTRETDLHDLSLGVINALAIVDVKSLSYMQLRRLFVALTHASDAVAQDIARRSDNDAAGDTVRIPIP